MKLNEELKGVSNVAITGHIRPDGDCLGSTLGLFNYIEKNFPDIDVDIYLEKPSNEFLYLKNISQIKNVPDVNKHYDLFFILDCSTLDRIEPFVQCYNNSDKKVCIDHHISNDGTFADVNEVFPQASSTCEVLFNILDEECIDKSIAECIYTGIIHDTGVLKYSCTSSKTMIIAGKMMDKGIDYTSIIDNTFYQKTYIQNQILGRALLESVLFYDGKCIFSSISKEIMDFYDVVGSDLGGVVEQLRLTEGVEVAIFMYESGDNQYKVSMRSKKFIDVSAIATEFGGGGHVRAAGFTAVGPVHEIINCIGDRIEKQYNKLNAD